MSWLLTSGSQSIGASASALVLPMNIQDWFPLGWTGFISLPSKRLSRVFSSTTVQRYQFFSTQSSLWSNFHITLGFPGDSGGKESASSEGDLYLIPGLERYSGEGKGYPLHYPGLEESVDCIVHGQQRIRHDWTAFTFTLFCTIYLFSLSFLSFLFSYFQLDWLILYLFHFFSFIACRLYFSFLVFLYTPPTHTHTHIYMLLDIVMHI